LKKDIHALHDLLKQVAIVEVAEDDLGLVADAVKVRETAGAEIIQYPNRVAAAQQGLHEA
jgi:hypothetical protein